MSYSEVTPEKEEKKGHKRGSVASVMTWQFTQLPSEVMEIVERDLGAMNHEQWLQSTIRNGVIDTNYRSSKNMWIPESHWISGFIMHYARLQNDGHYRYDISGISGNSLQYTKYTEGMFYNWHQDSGFQDMIEHDYVRKLSFVIQLTDPEDYVGGNLQIMDEANTMYVAPRVKGSIVFFDSRSRHRVTKLISGERKSLVGWIEGPRWK